MRFKSLLFLLPSVLSLSAAPKKLSAVSKKINPEITPDLKELMKFISDYIHLNGKDHKDFSKFRQSLSQFIGQILESYKKMDPMNSDQCLTLLLNAKNYFKNLKKSMDENPEKFDASMSNDIVHHEVVLSMAINLLEQEQSSKSMNKEQKDLMLRETENQKKVIENRMKESSKEKGQEKNDKIKKKVNFLKSAFKEEESKNKELTQFQAEQGIKLQAMETNLGEQKKRLAQERVKHENLKTSALLRSLGKNTQEKFDTLRAQKENLLKKLQTNNAQFRKYLETLEKKEDKIIKYRLDMQRYAEYIDKKLGEYEEGISKAKNAHDMTLVNKISDARDKLLPEQKRLQHQIDVLKSDTLDIKKIQTEYESTLRGHQSELDKIDSKLTKHVKQTLEKNDEQNEKYTDALKKLAVDKQENDSKIEKLKKEFGSKVIAEQNDLKELFDALEKKRNSNEHERQNLLDNFERTLKDQENYIDALFNKCKKEFAFIQKEANEEQNEHIKKILTIIEMQDALLEEHRKTLVKHGEEIESLKTENQNVAKSVVEKEKLVTDKIKEIDTQFRSEKDNTQEIANQLKKIEANLEKEKDPAVKEKLAEEQKKLENALQVQNTTLESLTKEKANLQSQLEALQGRLDAIETTLKNIEPNNSNFSEDIKNIASEAEKKIATQAEKNHKEVSDLQKEVHLIKEKVGDRNNLKDKVESLERKVASLETSFCNNQSTLSKKIEELKNTLIKFFGDQWRKLLEETFAKIMGAVGTVEKNVKNFNVELKDLERELGEEEKDGGPTRGSTTANTKPIPVVSTPPHSNEIETLF